MSVENLKNFLLHFSESNANITSDSSIRDVNILNPINTFDVEFLFFPSVDGNSLTSNNVVEVVEAKTTENNTVKASDKKRKERVDKKSTSVKTIPDDRCWGWARDDELKTETTLVTIQEEWTEERSVGKTTTFEKKSVASTSSLYSDPASLTGIFNVKEQHDNFQRQNGNFSLSFMHYLAVANLLFINNEVTSIYPLKLLLGYYILNITVPMLKIPDGKKSTTLLGDFPTNGTFVIPDNNTLQLTILNTRLPLLERVFYPWMREVTLPYWSYKSLPYTTATIIIDFNKHTDLKYVFCGCRPTQILTIQPNQENDLSFQRTVTMLFDYMFITSNLSTHSSAAGIGQRLLNMFDIEKIGKMTF